jgi:Bacterial mobilisation protein (MobC)
MERLEQRPKGKGGRPAKAVRREQQFSIRFTSAEYFAVREKAAIAGLSLTVFLREIALNGQIKTRLNLEEKQMIRQLIGMASNLNQLAKAAHQHGLVAALLCFEQYRMQFDDVINRLTNDK